MLFSEKLKEAMKNLNINQSQLVNMTGINKGSISLYLSGKVVPTEERKIQLATELGLPKDYFIEDESLLDFSKVKIQKLKVEEAARMMGQSVETIRDGLKQQRYGWGYAVQRESGQWVFFINAKKFAEIERIFT